MFTTYMHERDLGTLSNSPKWWKASHKYHFQLKTKDVEGR